MPIGPRGFYVSFGPHGFAYHLKLTESGALQSQTPESVLAEIQRNATRTNLFKVYVAATAIVLLWLITSPFFLFWLFTLALVAIFVYRWDGRRRTTSIFYDVDSDGIVARLASCNAAVEALARASSLWSIYNVTRTTQTKYSAGANALMDRQRIRCFAGSIARLQLNIEPWVISAGAQELLLLPDRLLFRDGKRFTALPYEWISMSHSTTSFVEDGDVPPDSKVVGTTWRFVNKSGGPDLRFNNNRQLPVLEYGELALRAASGLHIVIQASAPAATWHAANALQQLTTIASEPPRSLAHATPAVAPAAPPVRRPVTQPIPQAAPLSSPQSVARTPAPPARSLVTQPVSQVRLDQPRQPSVPVPVHSAPLVSSSPEAPKRRFCGADETLVVAGRTIARPLTFVTTGTITVDASTIVTSLPVGDARRAGPLPYWPSYADCDPHQRARYLDWMAGGRTDRDIDLGYVFIFFYGLEWRALRDRLDIAIARAEARRLLDLHGDRSGSLRSYASEFLVFAAITQGDSVDEAQLDQTIGELFAESPTAVAAVLAWYHRGNRPLPTRYAARVAASMEGAKRGVVVTRAARELAQLFASRYRDAHGEGISLVAAKRDLVLEYRPASSTWHRLNAKTNATLPNVLGKPSQFTPLVHIWNQCVEDLRKASRLKGKHDGELTAEAWAALPPDLRAQHDHPDRDRWDVVVTSAPRLGGFHLLSVGELAGLQRLEPAGKISAAQLRKIADTAAELGYAIEPDARVQRKGARWADEVLVWRAQDTSYPDPKLYGPAHILLSLAMQVAMADGTLLDDEAYVMVSMLGNMFALNETLRTRFVALQHLLARQPVRAAALAKKLQATRTKDDLVKVGRVLVAVAAADGSIADTEHAALQSLYKALGLSAADLAAAIAASGATLASDAAVEVRSATSGQPGELLPKPPEAGAVNLDHGAIASILADTRDVAAMLADVFDQDEDDDDVATAPEPTPQAPTEPVAPEILSLASGLDVRYHGVLAELLSKPSWTGAEVRSLAAKRRLMPGAILETINTWSDEVYGDFLIEEAEPWRVRAELVRRQIA